MANSKQSDLIRPKEAAAYLNMHLATLYRLSDRCETFPRKIKMGARLCYYRRSDLDAWLASREV